MRGGGATYNADKRTDYTQTIAGQRATPNPKPHACEKSDNHTQERLDARTSTPQLASAKKNMPARQMPSRWCSNMNNGEDSDISTGAAEEGAWADALMSDCLE